LDYRTHLEEELGFPIGLPPFPLAR
jgi:hypothetical protein